MQNFPETPEMALPSLGSVGHCYGVCRPCGFVHHKGGCTAGKDCSFCHLCPAGTIEKQRKMKRHLVRSQRQQLSDTTKSKCVVSIDVDVPAQAAPHASLMSAAAAASQATAGLRTEFQV
jgi:hypothetical protein